MSKKVKTYELYECSIDYIKSLLNSEYPWQILPKIKEHIISLVQGGAKGFTKLKDGVYVGANVKISPFATIEGLAIIGDNCEIRPGAYIRSNVITGSNCVIGNSSELKNCILLNNVQVPHYNYVGDSILGNFSHMGAGAICSNLKADKKMVVIHGETELDTGLRKVGAFLGDGADVGCGCVLNPGTIIGKNTCVYPLSVVRGVVPSNSIFKSKDNVVPKL